MNLVTPLNRVLGLGSAKGGVEHWWAQRVSAAALAVLGLWLLISLAALGDFSHAAVIAWAERPITSVLLILTVLTTAHHSRLGVQVVIEDYVHHGAAKVALLVLSTFAHVAIAIMGLFAVLKIAFAPVP